MNRDSGLQLAVVIPAYRPSGGLVDLVRTLTEKAAPPIVIVDDGSGPEFRAVFDAVAAFPGVQMLRHAVNLGKGAALKTAFNHVLCSNPGLVGVVTADADGQHHPDDILKVAEALRAEPEALVLGSRRFDQDVPLRSRFGNIATRGIMHALLGQKLTDTQTGLRGIPAGLLPRLLRLEASGYEFELEMLIAAHQLSMPVVEVPIQTIYEPGNKSSHFNPIIDSMKIYFVLLRFGSVSMLTALLDNLVFYLSWRRSGNIIASQLLGRLVAVCFNYSMVRRSVFYSHQQHKSVLPKYLALVLVSGTASYGAIQFLNQRLGMNPVSAKLLAETVLFFVNFAVQRMFIFKPQEGAAEEQRTTPMLVFSALVAAVFAILAGVEVYGFTHTRLFSQEIWFPVGWHRFTRYAGAFLLLAAPLLLMAPWTFAGFIALLILILTGVSVGPLPVLATAFFLLAAGALGSLLLGKSKQESVELHLCATLLGAGVYIFLMTFLARLPVNYPVVWGLLLALPILADLKGVGRRLRFSVSAIRSTELRSGWERAALALLSFLLIAQWFVALKPESGADALAMHLAIPMNIAEHHQLTFQPARFLWSVMPMGADWTYTIVYLFGGEYGARLLNFALLVVLVGLIYSATRRFVSPAAALLLAASFVAIPLVQVVTGSLFVENLLAGLILGLMIAIWRFGESGERRFLYLAMALGGTAIATKLGAMAFVLLALPFAIAEVVRHWKLLGRRPGVVCALALVLLLGTALPTYAIAFSKTGNPIFPFLNKKFHSPLLDPSVDLNDGRFHIPLDWTTLYTMTFHTSDAWEGQDGSFGFQYLVMAPLALIGLLVVAKRPAQSGAVLALGAAVVIMRSQPNVRYLYAAMPVLLVPFAGLLQWMHANQRWMYRVLLTYLVASTALNAWFLPSGSYYHKEFCLRFPFSRAERDRYRGEASPIREVEAYYNQHHPSSTVLLTGESAVAGVEGTVYVNHWHQFPTVDRLRQAVTLRDMFHLMRGWNVEYFIGAKPEPGDDLKPPALRAFLAACTVPEFEYRSYYLARLEPDCEQRGFNASSAAEPPLTVTEGFYDDFDPAIVMRGDWAHDQSFGGPDRHTISYTDVPGAEVSFAFEGKSLFYVFTKAPNRGIATVTIDGKAQEPVDLYAADILWQSRTKFCCFGPGRHLVVIKVTGDRNPKATGGFIDLDSFVVE